MEIAAVKYSILDNGEIIDFSRASVEHNRVLKKLDFAVTAAVKPPCEVFREQSYRWEQDTAAYRMPDLSVCCNPKSYNGVDISAVPWFVAEVISKSTENTDKNEKMNLFALVGVKEYWIVDPYKKEILIYINKDGKFEFVKSMTDFKGRTCFTSAVKKELTFFIENLFD